MTSLKSSNLCTPLGVFFEGDSLCMIMSRYSCDLRTAIDSRMKALRDEGFSSNGPPFTEQVTRFIILRLAVGLKALHECGVYHGDLKAANILLKTITRKCATSLPQPAHLAIADFERSEGVVGTAFFRVPEVLRSLITKIPLSKEQWLLADIYSFGMVCYEVLTGMIPFDGHLLSDYHLVLNGGRPKLPDHVPQYWRDLLLQCWHADPHSRPSWTDIIETLLQHDPQGRAQCFNNYINNLVSMESIPLESLIHKSKQLVRDLTTLHESDSKSFGSEFMPYYWASEFLVIVKEYASKFEVDSFLESRLICDVQEFFEWTKLLSLLRHQFFGASCGHLPFLNLILEKQLEEHSYVQKVLHHRELHAMLSTIVQRILFQGCQRPTFLEEFKVGTSWTNKLSFCHALVKWVLWNEHVEDGWGRKFMMRHLLPTHCSLDIILEALLIFFCMLLNTYIYILAMITYEPILLALQYGLYKAKGCNNILYRSSGERICRFQRVWMNCTRYKVVSITLSFSFVSLLTIYGWRGILC